MLTCVLVLGCAHSKKLVGNAGIPFLTETFKTDFAIGTTINAVQIEERDSDAAILIPQQFNTITPEKIMKAPYGTNVEPFCRRFEAFSSINKFNSRS